MPFCALAVYIGDEVLYDEGNEGGNRPPTLKGEHRMTETNTEAASAVATITPKDFAEMVGSDPKTVRRFLRSLTENRAGKGGRWAIDASDLDELKARWDARGTAKTVELTVDKPTIDVVDELAELDEDEEDLDDIDEL